MSSMVALTVRRRTGVATRSFPQLFEHGYAIELRQVDVEDYKVVLFVRSEVQPVLAVIGQIDRVTLFLEALAEEVGDLLFVLYNEDFHN